MISSFPQFRYIAIIGALAAIGGRAAMPRADAANTARTVSSVGSAPVADTGAAPIARSGPVVSGTVVNGILSLTVTTTSADTVSTATAARYVGIRVVLTSPGLPSSRGTVTAAKVTNGTLSLTTQIDGEQPVTDADVPPLIGVITTVTPSATAVATGQSSATTVPAAPTSARVSGSGSVRASGAKLIASADFDDGTFGSLTNETSSNSVIADPTGSGRGNVYRAVYRGMNGATMDTRADLNKFISYNPKSGLSHGSTVFFRGDVYFPANTPNFTNGNVLRKLTYWRTDRPSNQQVDFVLNMWGNQLGVSVARPGHEDHRNNIFAFNAGQWYRLEIQATMNSRPGSSDGIVRIWVNGAQVYEKLDESFTQASDPASTRWSWLTVGHQREGAFDQRGNPIENAITEERYWDDVSFRAIP